MIRWPEVFNLGIKEIDDQHRKIVELINQVYYNITEDGSIETMSTVFDSLHDYVRYHLRYEEEFMKKIKYPGFDLHKVYHDLFEG